MRKRSKAFTIVELMVAMAVIAVLLGLAAFGISTLNRLSRDNQRRTTVENIQRMLAAYYADYYQYPNPSDMVVSANTVSITGYAYTAVPLTGATRVADTTTLDGTRYCYSKQSDGYVLAAKLESGQYFNSGESQTKCSDTTSSFFLRP